MGLGHAICKLLTVPRNMQSCTRGLGSPVTSGRDWSHLGQSKAIGNPLQGVLWLRVSPVPAAAEAVGSRFRHSKRLRPAGLGYLHSKGHPQEFCLACVAPPEVSHLLVSSESPPADVTFHQFGMLQELDPHTHCATIRLFSLGRRRS